VSRKGRGREGEGKGEAEKDVSECGFGNELLIWIIRK
jgi:hypothetical protein